jgi:hypothetical protein
VGRLGYQTRLCITRPNGASYRFLAAAASSMYQRGMLKKHQEVLQGDKPVCRDLFANALHMSCTCICHASCVPAAQRGWQGEIALPLSSN